MPEMHYRLRWPDDSESLCYSPSLVIKDFFVPGTAYPLPDFLRRVREATHIASERVRAKYGFACSAAAGQLQAIEDQADRFSGRPDARVEVLSFVE
ncbi:MSMEG_0570 family nitrogen starvation response protein [Aquabacterium sp. J223]|uniref:MSMEG_0570 family nitrogen starvation response protein n=1 Tax=Aquabacterium sp. J223 TaxID=2898431 RepID=UPI0021ADEE7F|nr:MSMEG_0570 family nitrogen starvation response protein [Aquabacterium sp. J223]UUX97004.1 MSMEG_0570 family nitrogen starvation response protein [Aquabacterium sp. J223]